MPIAIPSFDRDHELDALGHVAPHLPATATAVAA
jgi:hypothetical protein